MRERREIALWTVAAVAGAALLAWAFPRAFPTLPGPWSVTAAEAEAIALERLRELGEPVARPYVVTRMTVDPQLERRLQTLVGEVGRETVAASRLAAEQVYWSVRVYEPGGRSADWRYDATIGVDGAVLGLRRRLLADEGEGAVDPAVAVERAREVLAGMGRDLAAYDPEPRLRRDDVGERTDTQVRFRLRAAPLADLVDHGDAVVFTGPDLAGFGTWYEDPAPAELRGVLQQSQVLFFGLTVLFTLELLLLAVPFLRRYHDGQLGVRRAVQLFVLCLSSGLVYLLLEGREVTETVQMGVATRRQVTWLVGTFLFTFQVLGLALLAFVSWSVGEAFCRAAGWSQKLASLDALVRGKWTNATVALASLRGVGAGLLAAGVTLAIAVPLQAAGVFTISQSVVREQPGSLAAVVSTLGATVSFLLPPLLFALLVVPCWAVARFGRATGFVVSLAAAMLVVTPAVMALPLDWGWVVWLVAVAPPVVVFFWGDLLSAVLTALVEGTAVAAMPLLLAADPRLELSGWLSLLAIAAPLVVSARWLGSEQRFVYHYDDIPPHVRRIAERERQRVELETAARIQSSILPDLPPSLHGVEVAHAYLPASEVGGDFYDLLALEDGRLAVAVGDVAGHGVSSGLVMSMAKSALSVQVTFDPEVSSVLHTLNRLVYQGARQRLLTTLCYAVLDPARRELLYASAGHLFPYCITGDGRVRALEAGSYPLGVRAEIAVPVRSVRLEAAETVFLYSDGLVEAVPDGDDEAFGFERLEAALRRHAGKPPGELRDGVLAEVEAWRGARPRDDDLTVLVLRLPAA